MFFRRVGLVLFLTVVSTFVFVPTVRAQSISFGTDSAGFLEEVENYLALISRALEEYVVAGGQSLGSAQVFNDFDFALTFNAGAKSVVQGSTITIPINVHLTSGLTQFVNFSLSGLPAGATGSFSSSACAPACSTTLFISVPTSVAAGTYGVMVRGTSGFVIHGTGFNLNVTSPIVDTTAPTISSITTSNITTSGATISWNTNEASDTQIEYGLTTSYGSQTTLNTSLVTSHSQSLSGLSPNTTYHYRVKSRDAAGNLAVSGDSMFTTESIVPTQEEFSFAFAIRSGIREVTQGESVTTTATVFLSTGTTQPVTLSLSNLPPGATASLTPDVCSPLCSVSITIHTLASTPAGSYMVMLTGTGGGYITSNGFLVTVLGTTPPPPSFDFSLSNGGSRAVTQGSSITNLITATLISGTSQSISYSASGLPSGATTSFSPASCNPTCSTTVTISSSASTPSGSYPVTVTGVGGGITKTTAFTLEINQLPSTRFVVGDRVETSVNLNVRATPSTSGVLLGTQIVGSRGTIVGGPTYANGLWWWNVNYDSGVDGWSAEDYLVKVIPDTTNPVVSLNASASGMLTSAGSVTLTASASDNTSIARVEFYDGSTLRSTDTSSPYVYTWSFNSADNGTHSFTARAYDGAGNMATSNAVSLSINIDATSPTVTVTAPANNATVSGITNVQATASDNVGVAGVQFKIDGVNLGTEDVVSPYSVAWDTATYSNGAHVLVAIARDAAGNTTTSQAVNVIVSNDTTAPTISSITTSNITTSGATISWNTNEASDTQIEYGLTTSYGSQTTLNTSLVTSHSQSLSGLSPNTTYHYRVKSRDAAGNLAVSGNQTLVTAQVPFDFSLGNGGSRSVTRGSSVTNSISATLSSGSGQSVSFTATTLPAGVTASFSPTSCNPSCSTTMTISASTSATVGNSTVVVTGTSGGVSRTTSFTLTVNIQPDTTNPSVSLASSITGTLTSAGSVTFTATASDNVGVSRVEFYDNGAFVATDNTFPYSYVWNYGSSQNGTHSWTARAYDAAGNTTTSNAVSLTVNVDTTAPTISSITASSITTSGATVTWTTNEASDTQVEYGLTTAYGSQTTLNTALLISHSQVLSGLQANTLYHYRVKSRDAAGNLALSTDRTFTTSQVPFDFSLSNGGSRSINQGASVTNSISATLASGSSQVVSFTTSGLPSGATASFSPTSCSPACSTTVTISTLASTPTGNSTVTVTGTGGGVTRTTTFSLTVNDGTAPTVSLGSSASGPFITSGSVTFTATASDNVGVSRVEFYDGTSLAATDTSAPYSHVWSFTSAQNGAHSWTARAYDAAGNTTTSSAVSLTVNVDAIAPTISNISTPTVTANSVQILWATNEPADTQVDYGLTTSYGSQTPLQALLSTGHTVNITGLTPNTLYHYRVRSRDAAGNLALSADRTFTTGQDFDFTLSDMPPVSMGLNASITQTVTATVISGASQQITFSVSAALPGLTASISPTSCNAPCSATVTVTTSPSASVGSGLVTVTATGGGIVRSDFFSVNVQSVTFTLSNGGPVSVPRGSSVTTGISVLQGFGTLQPVTFSIAGLPAGTSASFSPTSCTPGCSTVLSILTSASTPVGTFPITVVGTATIEGVIRQTAFNLTVNAPTTPTVSLTVNPPSPLLQNAGVSLRATLTNMATSTVRFYDGTTLVGTDSQPGNNSTYLITLSFDHIKNGTHSFSAVATDVFNVTATSNTLPYLVVILPPQYKFVVGDRIETTANLNVRSSPLAAATLLGTQPLGSKGNILAGPTYGDGFWWWQIAYDNGITGWSVTEYLTRSLTFGETWARSLGGADTDVVYAVARDANDNVFVGGHFFGTMNLGNVTLTSEARDAYIAKYSPTGTLMWAKKFGGASDDYLDSMEIDNSGNIIMTGRFSGTTNFGGGAMTASGPSDIVLAKYSGADGAHQWSKRFGGALDDGVGDVGVDATGNVYLTGYFRGTINFGGSDLRVPFDTDLDVFVAKFTPTGGHTWSKKFTNTGNDRGYGLAVDSSGAVFVTGSFSNTINFGGGELSSINAMTDIFLVRLTSDGAHSWSRRFGAGDANESAYAAITLGNGDVVIAGHVLKPVDFGGGLLTVAGGADGFVAQYRGSNGTHVWSRSMGGSGNDYTYEAARDASDNVYVTGGFSNTANFSGTSLATAGDIDVFVAKYNSSGNLISARSFGGTSADVGEGIAVASNGSPLIVGRFSGTGIFGGTSILSLGTVDGFFAKVAP